MPCAIERSRWIEQSRHWRMTERPIHLMSRGGPSGPQLVGEQESQQAGRMRLRGSRDENPPTTPPHFLPDYNDSFQSPGLLGLTPGIAHHVRNHPPESPW